jgi:membrane fusion protein, macrolide-specific efflux system
MKSYLVPSVVVLVLILALVLWADRKSSLQFVPIKRGNVEEAVYGLGKVKSKKVFELKLGVTDSIAKLFAQEGDHLKTGSPLVRFQGGSFFKAPFQGTVTAAPFHEGENIFPQAVALRLEDLTDLYVEVILEQQGALRIKPNQPAKMSFESMRGSSIEGKVSAVYPRDDQFVVRIDCEALPKGVFPGMTADVSIQVGRKENALLVPLASISNGRMQISRKGKKKRIDIQVGIINEDWGEVLAGDVTEEDLAALPRR